MTVNIVVIVELSVGGTFIPAPSKSSKNHIPVVQNSFFRYNYCFFRVELKKNKGSPHLCLRFMQGKERDISVV